MSESKVMAKIRIFNFFKKIYFFKNNKKNFKKSYFNEENRNSDTTFIYSTLKVEEIKVVSEL